MGRTLAERAAKIQQDFQNLPPETVQKNRQFFHDVWNFCGAVIESTQDDNGQFIAPSIMGD
jgi:hypothetical protein